MTYAITGITGKVGGAVARTLLQAGQQVRAVVRDAGRADAWAQRGCEVVTARMDDADALASAFEGVAGVFILPPSEFDPAPGYPEAWSVIRAVRSALKKARPAKVVCLSTVGAQAVENNLLTQRTLLEHEVRGLGLPMTFLRPAWFMENTAWDIAPARQHGRIHSFLQPLDRAIPMVATADVGRAAAQLLLRSGSGTQVVELEGPHRVSPADIAATLGRILGHAVTADAVARDSWNELFLAQGMKHPESRIRMLDGFNEGWITFEGNEADIVKGEVDLETVLRVLVAQS